MMDQGVSEQGKMKNSPRKSIQLNIPMDPEVARRLRILAALQDKTRSQFMRDIMEAVAALGDDIRPGDHFEVQILVSVGEVE